MLFRRFALVTTCIALLGILTNNLIQSTHPSERGFLVEQRFNEWKSRQQARSCEQADKLCGLAEFRIKQMTRLA